jgi:hypothetical protein
MSLSDDSIDDDDAPFEMAWSAFWADARNLSVDRPGLRQAFKTGAAFLIARGVVRGSDAFRALIDDDVRVVQEVWSWAATNMMVHPDWSKVHRDAILAGALAVGTLVRANQPIMLDDFEI